MIRLVPMLPGTTGPVSGERVTAGRGDLRKPTLRTRQSLRGHSRRQVIMKGRSFTKTMAGVPLAAMFGNRLMASVAAASNGIAEELFEGGSPEITALADRVMRQPYWVRGCQRGRHFTVRVPSVRQVPSSVTHKHVIPNRAYISRLRGLLSMAR